MEIMKDYSEEDSCRVEPLSQLGPWTVTKANFVSNILSFSGFKPYGDNSIDFDNLVADTGCSGASDKLQCLREVDFKTLKDAINNSPNIFSYQVSSATSETCKLNIT
jgi:hypothetical protein